jgi:hypothetical protein
MSRASHRRTLAGLRRAALRRAKSRGAPASKWLNSLAGCCQRRRTGQCRGAEQTYTAHSGLYEAVERRIGAGEHPPSQAAPRERASTDSPAREARTPVQAVNRRQVLMSKAPWRGERQIAGGVRYSPDASRSASSRSFRPTGRTPTSATSRKSSSISSIRATLRSRTSSTKWRC